MLSTALALAPWQRRPTRQHTVLVIHSLVVTVYCNCTDGAATQAPETVWSDRCTGKMVTHHTSTYALTCGVLMLKLPAACCLASDSLSPTPQPASQKQLLQATPAVLNSCAGVHLLSTCRRACGAAHSTLTSWAWVLPIHVSRGWVLWSA
jgi:hypothetical protein